MHVLVYPLLSSRFLQGRFFKELTLDSRVWKHAQTTSAVANSKLFHFLSGIAFSLVLPLRGNPLVVGAILQRGVASFHGVAHNLKANNYYCNIISRKCIV